MFAQNVRSHAVAEHATPWVCALTKGLLFSEPSLCERFKTEALHKQSGDFHLPAHINKHIKEAHIAVNTHSSEKPSSRKSYIKMYGKWHPPWLSVFVMARQQVIRSGFQREGPETVMKWHSLYKAKTIRPCVWPGKRREAPLYTQSRLLQPEHDCIIWKLELLSHYSCLHTHLDIHMA